jgi:hypothetical protein
MATVIAKARKLDQETSGFENDRHAEEEMRKRWNQLRKRRQASQSDK